MHFTIKVHINKKNHIYTIQTSILKIWLSKMPTPTGDALRATEQGCYPQIK